MTKTRFSRKINGKWDFSSREGPEVSGIICPGCGAVVELAYRRPEDGFYYCPSCFKGNKDATERITLAPSEQAKKEE